MKKTTSRLLSIMLAICMIFSLALPGMAASWDEAIIDMDAAASITLHKYDWTNALKDGVWDNSYVSTGVEDTAVEALLGAKRVNGDLNDSADHPLGNGESSNGYAIKGVEFSYLRVADIAHFTESTNDGHDAYNLTKVLYGFDKTASADLLTAIGLDGATDSYANAANTDKLSDTNWWFESDVLVNALSAALIADSTGVKDALEVYINAQLGTCANGEQKDLHTDANTRYDAGRMTYTDADGFTTATNLEVGLYLLVETLVPEMVTSTTNPFFLSLPMTSVDGKNAADGGHRWIYDVELYPKNETGIVTLEKTVREELADTGKNTDTDVITDGFAHNATASTGDTVEYQIISTLPMITSQVTAISDYTFYDKIAAGITYTEDTNVKIQWYTDAACTNLVDTWDYAEGYFSVDTDNDTHERTIAMTEDGFAIINGLAGDVTNVYDNANGGLLGNEAVQLAGYSNYTMRITYTAKLDSDNTFVYGDEGNCNTVTLTWKRSNTDYYDTILDDCHVYSYGIDLTKQFSDKTQDEAHAAGMFEHVKFVVRNITEENGVHTAGYYVIAEKNEAEGIWYVIGHTENEAEATIISPLKPTNYDGEEGHIIIKGLEDDTYELTEVETANTYTLLKDRITVYIWTTETTAYCPVYDNEVKEGVYQNDGHYQYEGCPDLALANIPQKYMEHKTLTADATVDTNAITMNRDYDPTTGEDLVVGQDGEGNDLYSENALVPLTVINTHGFDLPQTGQEGATNLPLIGATVFGVCVLFAMFILFLPRRKEEEQAQ